MNKNNSLTLYLFNFNEVSYNILSFLTYPNGLEIWFKFFILIRQINYIQNKDYAMPWWRFTEIKEYNYHWNMKLKGTVIAKTWYGKFKLTDVKIKHLFALVGKEKFIEFNCW